MATKAEETQRNILETAKRHFLNDGLTGASLRKIVKEQDLQLALFISIIRLRKLCLMR